VQRPAAPPATDGETLATPDPGRDNTASRPRHNLLTPSSGGERRLAQGNRAASRRKSQFAL